MTTTRQFWTLFKLQPSINPVILFMPLALAFPLMIPLLMRMSSPYHANLGSLTGTQNSFLVAFFGVLFLCPELFGKGNAKWTSGIEFFVTRALDRPILYRARLASYYIAILTIPILLLLGALQKSDVQIRETNPADQREIVKTLPNSTLIGEENAKEKNIISIPNGAFLIGAFNLWIFLIWGIATQFVISLISPLKYGKHIFWAIFAILIAGPLIIAVSITRSTLHTAGSKAPLDITTLTWTESLFLQFVSYQPFIWIATAIALVTIHLWCEHRFARAEY